MVHSEVARPALIQLAARLRGRLRVPGDKSISHRALMLALLAEGESRISGAGDGADVRSTAGIVAALGATVEREMADDGGASYRVVSPGRAGLRGALPARGIGPLALDCGNSGTSLRLFAGILAGTPVTATLDGDASLRGRPMARIIEPLRAMGATIIARDDSLPPLTVTGRARLRSIDWTTPVPSAQVKSSILLAGLAADSATIVRERIATRDHTERMLRARGVAIRSERDGDGAVIEVEGGATVRAIDERIPGDPSAAAFWLVAGSIHPDAELRIDGVGVNPTRRAVIDLLRRMGAKIDEAPAAGSGPADAGGVGEPIADLVVRTADLEALDAGPSDVASAIDEIPVLALAATQARGRSWFRGAGELRHKESDRLAGIAAGLAALGADVAIEGDDLRIDGPTPLHGAPTASLDDHRVAMTFAIAGLLASGETSIDRPASAAISYPAFFNDLERIRA